MGTGWLAKHITEQKRKLHMILGKMEKKNSYPWLLVDIRQFPICHSLHLQLLFQTCILWSQQAGAALSPSAIIYEGLAPVSLIFLLTTHSKSADVQVI